MQTTADASAVGAGAWLRVAVSEVGIRRWVGRPSLQKHIRLLQFFEDTLSLKLLPFDVRRKENACVAKQRRHAVRELFHRSSVWRREVFSLKITVQPAHSNQSHCIFFPFLLKAFRFYFVYNQYRRIHIIFFNNRTYQKRSSRAQKDCVSKTLYAIERIRFIIPDHGPSYSFVCSFTLVKLFFWKCFFVCSCASLYSLLTSVRCEL